jgi:hypothetical protein
MLLVPRQLQRSGLTGNIPYYGGRFTPAQAYAASHPREGATGHGPPDDAAILARAPVPPVLTTPAASRTADNRGALEQLRLSGVITQLEYDQLLARVDR